MPHKLNYVILSEYKSDILIMRIIRIYGYLVKETEQSEMLFSAFISVEE